MKHLSSVDHQFNFLCFLSIADMQEKERFERYTPKFPLPSDIASMSRQDTVCQFCGVSYLIHNEIKALEAKCQKLESDLAYYIDMPLREAALEKSLQTERTRVTDLESTVAIYTHKYFLR
jgi:hypothetical protein